MYSSFNKTNTTNSHKPAKNTFLLCLLGVFLFLNMKKSKMSIFMQNIDEKMGKHKKSTKNQSSKILRKKKN